jgi:hypothetical protein
VSKKDGTENKRPSDGEIESSKSLSTRVVVVGCFGILGVLVVVAALFIPLYDLQAIIHYLEGRLEEPVTPEVVQLPTYTPYPTHTPLPIASPTPEPPPTSTPLDTILSSFDGINIDGWRANEGSPTNPGLGGNTRGEKDGYLRLEPQGPGTSYFFAPPIYHRDWRVFPVLRVDLWSSGGDYFTEGHRMHGDIYLVNGELTAYRLLPHRPPESWETFIIPLEDDGHWTLGTGTMSLDDVLANVTDFQIRAEYGVGLDYSGLDNVELGE